MNNDTILDKSGQNEADPYALRSQCHPPPLLFTKLTCNMQHIDQWYQN